MDHSPDFARETEESEQKLSSPGAVGSFCRRRFQERRTLIKVGAFIPCDIDRFRAEPTRRESAAGNVRAVTHAADRDRRTALCGEQIPGVLLATADGMGCHTQSQGVVPGPWLIW